MDNITLFAQIARLIPRSIVEEAAKKFKSDKGASRLDTWTHLLSMIFCHIGNCLSLRDITNGMRSAGGNLNHMGIGSAPSRNALSHQNRQRNCEVWKYLYKRLHDYWGRQTWGRRIAGVGKRSVYLLDSSLITLCANVFDWAHDASEKGAVKMHTLFNLSDWLPQFIHITNGKVSDNIGAYYVLPRKGSVIVADRGYCDTALLHDWDSSGICFVVRLRRDLHYSRLGEFEQPDEGEQNILIDEAIQFSGEATNNAKWSAETVAALYKARWDIEIFFKTIKQLLRVKSFVGTNANAVYTQIRTAMIAVLLLRMLKAQSKFAWHMSNLVSFLRLNLFNKMDLWKWLNEPFEKPPPRQKTLWEGVLF